MALVRLSRPGLPTDYIDLGPATGRIHGQSYGGTSLTAALPPPAITSPTQDKDRIRNARNRELRKAAAAGLCGRAIPSGTCARARGHGYSCRTREWLDRRAAAYRESAKQVMTEAEKTPTMVVSSQPNIEVQR